MSVLVLKRPLFLARNVFTVSPSPHSAFPPAAIVAGHLGECSIPPAVRGVALTNRYIKRKQEQEAAAAASKAEKTIKLKKEMSEADMLFGDVIQPSRTKKIRRIMSPRVVVGTDRAMDLDRPSASVKVENGTPTGEDTGMEGYEAPASGMGVKDEAMGLLTGGSGLKDVGLLHEDT